MISMDKSSPIMHCMEHLKNMAAYGLFPSPNQFRFSQRTQIIQTRIRKFQEGGAYGLLNEHLQLNARNGTGSEKGLDVFLGNIQHANNCDAEGKLIAHRNTTARSSSFFSRGSLTVLYCNYSLAAVGSVDPLCSAGLKNTV